MNCFFSQKKKPNKSWNERSEEKTEMFLLLNSKNSKIRKEKQSALLRHLQVANDIKKIIEIKNEMRCRMAIFTT